MCLKLYFMIAIIEVARHFLFLWRPALLPPLRRAGTESHGGQGQAASFITSSLHHNLIFYLRPVKVPGLTGSFQ